MAEDALDLVEDLDPLSADDDDDNDAGDDPLEYLFEDPEGVIRDQAAEQLRELRRVLRLPTGEEPPDDSTEATFRRWLALELRDLADLVDVEPGTAVGPWR